MDNLKWEYSKATNAFIGPEEDVKWWHMVLLAPIAIPMAIIGGIADLLIGTIPDMLFGIHYPEQPELTPEEIEVRKQRYADMLEEERKQRVEEIRQRIFPNGIFPEDKSN